ncbi:MAG: 4Fe-4S binding protein [Bacillota bacterium]
MAGSVELDPGRCKRCDICVEFCPKGVFVRDGAEVRVARPDDCSGCLICELLCPDHALRVTKGGEGR